MSPVNKINISTDGGNLITLFRKQILEKLQSTLEPLDTVFAAWLGGAAAFERVDEWSDIDLLLIVLDDCVENVFNKVEETLKTLSPIDLCYRVETGPNQGYEQCFYRLRDAGEFLFLDLAIIKESSPKRFLETSQHGKPIILFDKKQLVVPPEEDEKAFEIHLANRVKRLETSFHLFQSLIKKEIFRENEVEALAFYHSHTLRPLVELLRIQHDPKRHSFYVRYIKYDLPENVQNQLKELYFVKNLEDIRVKRERAEALFEEILAIVTKRYR